MLPRPPSCTVPPAPDPTVASTQAPARDLSGLRYRWPGTAADTLQLGDLTLQPGETVFLRGPSGCGKSTLLALAAGVLLPQAGHCALLGQAWTALGAGARDRRRADHLGYIFQQFNLLPYLSVIANVRLPLRFSRLRAARAAASGPDAAAELLAHAGLPRALWQAPASNLSVGQQQRVAAARALIGAPEVVIADEPTSALDEALREAFMALLLARCQAAGSALLFVSHDLRLAGSFHRVIDLPAINQARPVEPAA